MECGWRGGECGGVAVCDRTKVGSNACVFEEQLKEQGGRKTKTVVVCGVWYVVGEGVIVAGVAVCVRTKVGANASVFEEQKE